jgi:hypothetical protein
MALILAMLVVLVLSGISLVAVQATYTRLNLAGTARVTQVARQVSLSGAEGTMALAALNPSGFNQYVEANNSLVQMEAISGEFFDLSPDGSGSFGREIVSVETAFWQSRMVASLTSHRAPGFQLGEYCFRKHVSVTDGIYRNDADPTDANAISQAIERNAQARALANLFVGPITCP